MANKKRIGNPEEILFEIKRWEMARQEERRWMDRK